MKSDEMIGLTVPNVPKPKDIPGRSTQGKQILPPLYPRFVPAGIGADSPTDPLTRGSASAT